MMRRTWVVALAGLGLLVLAILWLSRDQKRSPAEPTSRAGITARIQGKRIARDLPMDCAPLAAGGFSCDVCRDDADCPEGSGCVVNLQSGGTECQGSDCRSSDDCDAGTFCRVIGRTARDEPLRACVPPGTRLSGAACDPNNGGDPSVSCAANLLCVNGGCAPACVPAEVDEEPICPGLLPCVQTEVGWGCTPTCKQQACDDGKTCSFVSVENPTSLCTQAVNENCLGSLGGCGAGHDCIVETNAQAERTTFSCARRCTPRTTDGTCPPDFVCVPDTPRTGHCRRRCSADGRIQCAAGERCTMAVGSADTGYCSAA